MEDFNIFSNTDKRDISYAACVGGSVLVGASIGRFAALPGLFALSAAGLVIGLFSCKRLAPAIERKIFTSNQMLNDSEIAHTLRVIRDETGIQSKSDALFLLAIVRQEVTKNPQCVANRNKSSLPMRIVASQLLTQRG
jgi:hypothetical protein